MERGFLRLAWRAAEGVRIERPGDGKEAEDHGFLFFLETGWVMARSSVDDGR